MLPDDFPDHLFFVGCGNMGGAMLSRWLEAGLRPERVTVLRPSGKPVAPGVSVVTRAPDALPRGCVLLLAMKPQQLAEVAPVVRLLAAQARAVVSVLAGVRVAQLGEALGGCTDILRVMPNTPVAIGRGVSGVFAGETASASARSATQALLAPLGLVEWIAQEDQFNLLTALSGCGPAYVFRFIDALAQAAHALGMERGQAERIANATVAGASALSAISGDAPALLADRVASPGGMTREGLDILDADGRLVQLLTETLRAARDRGEVLAQMARN